MCRSDFRAILKLTHFALLAALLAFAPPARAQDDEHPACMAPIAIGGALVSEAGRFGWRGAEARGAAPAFLIGELYYLRDDQEIAGGAHGGIVFVRSASGAWRAFIPMPGEDLVAAYAAPSTGAVMLATQLQTEGPGESWTLARLGGECREIAFPAALNQPNWANENLELHDFDIRADGRGEIVGVARVERGGGERTWVFRYRTSDAGATWAAPMRIARVREARPGLFEKADGQAPAALVAELERATAMGPH